MRTIIVTGSAGLISSETVRRFAKEGAQIVGIDNGMRARFFGREAAMTNKRIAPAVSGSVVAGPAKPEHYPLCQSLSVLALSESLKSCEIGQMLKTGEGRM